MISGTEYYYMSDPCILIPKERNFVPSAGNFASDGRLYYFLDGY